MHGRGVTAVGHQERGWGVGGGNEEWNKWDKMDMGVIIYEWGQKGWGSKGSSTGGDEWVQVRRSKLECCNGHIEKRTRVWEEGKGGNSCWNISQE